MKFLCFMLFYSFFLSNLYVDRVSSISGYTITPSQSLKDGQNLTSQSETFELGFFSPSNSKSRYLGIWYKKIPLQTIVWVANRDSPLNDSSGLGVFMISSTGNFVILNRTNHVVWSTNSSKTAANPIAEFLESGNLVLRDNKSDGYIWQSFDHPTDTLLPGMKLGWDLRTGLNRYLTSWRSTDDPSTGDYTFGIELNEYPEPVMKYGSSKYYRNGLWNGIWNSGLPELRNNIVFINTVVHNKTDVYYSYQLVTQAVTARLMVEQIGSDGLINQLTWVNQGQNWFLQALIPVDRCDSYGLCGAGATCNINDVPVCQCLKGFKPESAYDYNEMDWSWGCQHATPLNCDKGDGFMKFKELKLPDTAHTWLNTSMSLEECRYKCLKNCSCMAYANSDIHGNGSGCAMWFGDLIDIRKLLGAGQDLYIRMAASELDQSGVFPPLKLSKARSSGGAIAGITVAVGVVVLLVAIFMCVLSRRKKMRKGAMLKVPTEAYSSQDDRGTGSSWNRSLESAAVVEGGSPRLAGITVDKSVEFSYEELAQATNDFSLANKIGEGGFGAVYYAELRGEKAAIKKMDMQAKKEFLAELKVLTHVHHLNLVRLIGYCVEGSLFLVYEFIENGNLSQHLRGSGSEPLPWSTRVQIALDSARGLEYIHEHTVPVYIHRDIKPANILIDHNFHGKVADFGLAKLTEVGSSLRTRLVGTFGYMSPEYAQYGEVSPKIDVFAFGVVLYELISAKEAIVKADGSSTESKGLVSMFEEVLNQPDPRDDLCKLVDPRLGDNYPFAAVWKLAQLAKACTHENFQLRPSMRSIVAALMTLSSATEDWDAGS